MSVSGLTIAVLIFNMLVGIAVPLVLMIFLRKKFKCDYVPFWVGCGVMFAFALVLEQIVHTVVLLSPAGAVIQSRLWLYALYGGLMAGIFEETGRFVAMKFVLKKNRGNDYNALMYGAGHGGFEAFYILFFTMLNNLLYSLMLNSGSAETVLNSLDDTNREAMQEVFAALAETSPLLFLASPVERIAAVTAHIALSVLVWFAVKEKGKLWLYVLAVLLHALLDLAAVVLSGLGLSVAVIEILLWVIAAIFVLIAVKTWRTNHRAENKI